MIVKYSGVNISSKNPKKLVEFYRDVLGIPVIENDEEIVTYVEEGTIE